MNMILGIDNHILLSTGLYQISTQTPLLTQCKTKFVNII